MATTATVKYTVSRTTAALATIQAKLAAVPLPFADLSNFGLSVSSDVTNIVGNDVERVIQISLLPLFTDFSAPFAPVPLAKFQGSIVSSSPDDFLDGVGIHSIQFEYISPGLLPSIKTKSKTASLSGTTPVNLLPPSDIRSIVGTQILSAGSSGTNAGLISIYSELNARGKAINIFPHNFQGSIISSNPNDTFAAGEGAQQITITYTDVGGGGPFIEVVNLDGNTPVNLVNLDHYKITGMAVSLAGSITQNLGTITIMSGLNGTGGPVAQLAPSFFSFFPPTSDLRGLFRQLYTQIIAQAMVSFTTTATVVIA